MSAGNDDEGRADLASLIEALSAQMRGESVVALILEYRAVGGHPDDLATLVASTGWGGPFEGVRLVPLPWADRGVLYAGALVAAIASRQERETEG